MFTNYLKNVNLGSILLSKEQYRPFPVASERTAWEQLPDKLKKHWLAEGEKYLDYQWPHVPAVRFMDFRRDGNRSKYEALHFARRQALSSLVLAECMEGRQRFIDDIINGIWCICEESFWGVPAHNYNSRYPQDPLPDVLEPIIDLFAAETAGLMAWAFYLLKPQLDSVSPLICERIQLETKRRILDPFLDRNDFWWMGYIPNRKVNNWNPWIHSNCLTAFLLLEEDPDRRIRAVAKSMESLDQFMAVYHSDGGCDEGTSYWGRAGASLFDCLELLYGASDGKINFFEESIVKEIGRFIYRSYIHGDYFINFADGGARVKIAGDLVYRYGKRIGDPLLMAMGSSAFHSDCDIKVRDSSLLRKLPEVFNFAEIESADSTPPYIRDSWLDGIQVMAAREKEGSEKGLYLAAKGGNNDESHNHNDVGQFIVYADGRPMLIDVGVETYTSKTFSSRRYEIWTMQSAYHNLPTVNGFQQKAGKDFKASDIAYHASAELAELSMDISTAYPASAGMESWKRTFSLHRKGKAYIEITDDFKLTSASGDIQISLLTPAAPKIEANGRIVLEKETVKMLVEFDGEGLEGTSERIEIKDDKLGPVWGDHLYRIVLSAKTPVMQGVWRMKIIQE